MSAHAIVTAIEEEARAFCRSRMTGRPEPDLDAKEAHCQRLIALVRKLRPQIGVPEALTFAPGTRHLGGRKIVVVEKAREARKRARRAA